MPKITEMYAFVCEDKGPDDEGIMGFMDPATMQWMPLVGADTKRVDSLRHVADQIAEVTKKPYRVLQFKLVGELPKKT